MTTVIKVENLSKRYRIGLKESRKDTLFGQIGHTLTAPVRNFKQLRSMTRFGEEDESVFWALKDINFEVKQGEVLGIIGHNGAGKSTLLKLLSRITEPTSGRITLNGRVAALLEVGTGFHPDLTGRENIYMNGTILGMTRREIDRKLEEIVDFSGVEKYIDTPVKFYSSGMKVRLGFSVAAHLEPEILIIDEVLAVGDAEFQKKCLGKMDSVSKEGRTVLFVSHDMGSVEKLCANAITLEKGRIYFKGGVRTAISNYISKEQLRGQISFENASAPGNEHAKLKVATLKGYDENIRCRFDSGECIFIQIEYWDYSSLSTNTAIIHILNEKGQVLFATNEFNNPSWETFHKEPGIITAKCKIPGNFLQPGKYSVFVAIGNYNPNMIHLSINDALSFEVGDVIMDGVISKKVISKWPGMIRPHFDWEISRQ